MLPISFPRAPQLDLEQLLGSLGGQRQKRPDPRLLMTLMAPRVLMHEEAEPQRAQPPSLRNVAGPDPESLRALMERFRGASHTQGRWRKR